jgi:hypothetical protein
MRSSRCPSKGARQFLDVFPIHTFLRRRVDQAQRGFGPRTIGAGTEQR